MATGFKSNATTDFLEEWKAKREKMRAKMLGDIAAATGACTGNVVAAGGVAVSHGGTSNASGVVVSHGGTNNASKTSEAPPPPPPPPLTTRSAVAPGTTELSSNNGGPAGVNCVSSSSLPPVTRSASSSALKRPEEESHHPAVGGNLKKTPQQAAVLEKADKVLCAAASPQDAASTPSSTTVCTNDSDKEKETPSSPPPSKGKEKKTAGPSARKGKGQIEKRKLREKRRSTGVVSLPSNESLDELDDDDTGEKERKREEQLVQANTCQNEAIASDPGHPGQESPRSGSGRNKSSAGPGSEEELGANSRNRQGRHGREAGGPDRRTEELEKELARERQENARLLKAHEDKDDLIGKLKEEIDLLNRDIDDIEDENEQLKQENKTLLKVVGQLTR